MPEVIIKFQLPEEKDEFTLATKGSDYWCCLWDFNQYLRGGCKYRGDEWAKLDGLETLESVRDKLLEILRERGCSLEDVS